MLQLLSRIYWSSKWGWGGDGSGMGVIVFCGNDSHNHDCYSAAGCVNLYIFSWKKKKKNQHDKDGFLVMKTDECLIPLALLSDMLLSIRLIIFIFAALLLWCRLKRKSCLVDSLIVTGCFEGCQIDSLQSIQWQSSCQHDNFSFSVPVILTISQCVHDPQMAENIGLTLALP